MTTPYPCIAALTASTGLERLFGELLSYGVRLSRAGNFPEVDGLKISTYVIVPSFKGRGTLASTLTEYDFITVAPLIIAQYRVAM
tara:strand:+ start:98 stop:352 length:255 start_codon:yes stop_codon:yes gene_type:complete